MEQREIHKILDNFSREELYENLIYLIREMSEKDQAEFLGVE